MFTTSGFWLGVDNCGVESARHQWKRGGARRGARLVCMEWRCCMASGWSMEHHGCIHVQLRSWGGARPVPSDQGPVPCCSLTNHGRLTQARSGRHRGGSSVFSRSVHSGCSHRYRAGGAGRTTRAIRAGRVLTLSDERPLHPPAATFLCCHGPGTEHRGLPKKHISYNPDIQKSSSRTHASAR